MMINKNLIGKLNVITYASRLAMGKDAARFVSEKIRDLLVVQEYVNIIFASAPSQQEFLDALVNDKNINWSRVVGFHMDEYIGLDSENPQSFASFLRKNLVDHVPIYAVHFIDGNAKDSEAECLRYASLLREHPADIVCMGIGENTHIAFNDPHIADFNDPKVVKIVDLDLDSRQQQVNDGCFLTLDEVPTHALTLTIPALLAATYVYCMVPGKNKRQAVYQTLNEEISTRYPATILREHPDAMLFLDQDSAMSKD